MFALLMTITSGDKIERRNMFMLLLYLRFCEGGDYLSRTGLHV